MRLLICLFFVTFFKFGWFGAAVFADKNITTVCPAIPVHVGPASNEDYSLVCNAAEKALNFFQTHGIEMNRQIRIRLHQTEINNHANHIGLYDARRDRIDLVTLQHALYHCKEKRPFRVQMNNSLYASFVTHEVAHAIAEQNFNSTPSSLVAPEYLAYVTQFSTMDEQLRQQILQRYKVTPFTGIEDMSQIYYELNPNAFGVKAFLHYQSLDNKTQFIQGLLSGVINPVRPQMEWR